MTYTDQVGCPGETQLSSSRFKMLRLPILRYYSNVQIFFSFSLQCEYSVGIRYQLRGPWQCGQVSCTL
jgi:hypothetical protein